MRGCLFVVVTGLAVLAAAAWFGAPPMAELLVRSSLQAGGLESTERIEVDVTFTSPGDLLAGRAKTVRIETGRATIAGVGWRQARMELGEVELLGARFAAVDIELDAPTFRGATDGVGLAALRLVARGSADAAATRITMSADQVLELGRASFESSFGGSPDRVDLSAPAIASGSVRGVPFNATIRLDDGALVIVPERADLAAVELFRPDASVPFQIEGVRVEAGELVIVGTLDVSKMLGA